MRESSRVTPLPTSRLDMLEGWGMVSRSMGYVYRPSTEEGVRAAIQTARSAGRSIIPRGNGYSYGDAALNAENIVLDTSRMTRVLDWDPERGLIEVEPGVTIRQLYRHVLEDGWWPAVVPGAMYPTMGGCVSTNVHGKNQWHAGIFGDHVRSLRLLLPNGEIETCGPDTNPELFRAAIGGLGLLGVVLAATIQLKPVTSGLLTVAESVAGTLDDMFGIFASEIERAQYMVGWIDGFATGRQLGRGLVQLANDVRDDPAPYLTLRPDFQDLPDTILGLIPRSRLWLAMKPTVNDPGMRLLNSMRYGLGRIKPQKRTLIPHAQFQFFHDFVPGWKRSFLPGGIVQYQPFVPADQARDVFATLLTAVQAAGFYPYLAVFKRHVPDQFVLSYGVDGYSLSLDFRPPTGRLDALQTLLRQLTREIVLPAGGRFYLAKDNTVSAEEMMESFGAAAASEFLAIKRQVDPGELFQSDMYRRLLIAGHIPAATEVTQPV